jgi:hypothetical protein
MASITPAEKADKIKPAKLGTMACMRRKLRGF